jgi:hypothetical protein
LFSLPLAYIFSSFPSSRTRSKSSSLLYLPVGIKSCLTMMSPKWNDPDPGFVAMSQAFTLNPYRDGPLVSNHPMSPVTAYPEPLSSCLAEPESDSGLQYEYDSDLELEPEHEPELSPPQEIKQEISQSTMETLLQGFAGVRSSTASSSNGYLDEYGCAHCSDTVETIESFPSLFNATWESQSHLPMVGGITHGSDGLITTQVASNGGTAGYFSVFPTSYQPQQSSYATDTFGTATSDTASYGAAPYSTASYANNAYGNSADGSDTYSSNAYANNAYGNAYSNPYSTTAYGLPSIQDMTGPQMGLELSQQFNPYNELEAQMPLSASSMSLPVSNASALTIATPSTAIPSTPGSGMVTSNTVPSTPDCSLHHYHPSESARVPPGSPIRGGNRSRRISVYRYVAPRYHSAGDVDYVPGDKQPTTSAASVKLQQPATVRGTSRDSVSRRSRSSRASSSSSSASSTRFDRQTILDSIPLQKLRAMQKVPLPPKDDNLAKDRYIVKGKQLKLSYGQIKAIAGWTDAESTLRGRFRNFTKAKHERVRKPVWQYIDVGIPSFPFHFFLTFSLY